MAAKTPNRFNGTPLTPGKDWRPIEPANQLYRPQTLDYDYAVNSVLNALSEDHHRSRSLKKIPVRIHGQLLLPENTRRMLADRFNLLTS